MDPNYLAAGMVTDCPDRDASRLERMARRERALSGDPGIPADRRRKILERLMEKATAELKRLTTEEVA